MEAVPSELPWSLEYIPPSADCLFDLEVEDLSMNIEDALCSPDNEEVFLSASMAFLQAHLMRKLQDDIHSRFHKKYRAPERTYSELLIMESSSKVKQKKVFVRLRDVDRYEEVLKKEASTPQQTLSFDQLFPVSKKKSSWKLPIKSSSNVAIKSGTLLKSMKPSGFLRNPFKPKTRNEDGDVKSLPCECEIPRTTELNLSYLAVNRLKMASTFVNPLKMKNTASLSSVALMNPLTSRVKITQSDLELFRFLSKRPTLRLSEQIHEIKRNCSRKEVNSKALNDYILPSVSTNAFFQSDVVKNSGTSYVESGDSERLDVQDTTQESTNGTDGNSESELNAPNEIDSNLSFHEEQLLSAKDSLSYSSIYTNVTDDLKSQFSSVQVLVL